MLAVLQMGQRVHLVLKASIGLSSVKIGVQPPNSVTLNPKS